MVRVKRQLQSEYPKANFVGYRDPSKYYNRASILVVSPIGYDNFPTVVLEGMQHGLCVVGHKIGGIQEIIEHNKTGILYDSPDTLSSILPSLMTRPDHLKNLGTHAQETFYDKFTWDKCLDRYLNLYEHLTNTFEVNQEMA